MAGTGTTLLRPTPASGSVTYYAQTREFAKSPCKIRSLWQLRGVSRGPVAGEPLDDLEHGREVLLAQPAPDARAVELAREPCERERRPGAARLLQAEVHVLEHVLELEEHGDVVVDHRLALELAHRRVRRAARHDVQQRAEVDPDPAPDRDRLRERGAVDRRHALGEDLDRLALAGRPAWTIF